MTHLAHNHAFLSTVWLKVWLDMAFVYLRMRTHACACVYGVQECVCVCVGIGTGVAYAGHSETRPH
jgi:hypothetical protein